MRTEVWRGPFLRTQFQFYVTLMMTTLISRKFCSFLNSLAEAYNLQQFWWKLPFRMRVSDSET